VMLKLKADTDAKMEAIITEMNASDLPEGIQPRADDVVYLGGTLCTSTEPSCKPLPIAREALCETSSQSAITMSALEKLARGTPNLSTPVPEMPQQESITSMAVTEHIKVSPEAFDVFVKILENPPAPNEALKALFKTETVLPFNLPMEN